MTGTTGRGRAALVEGDTEFDARDAALLGAIDRAGSVAGAASELGRSRARALARIETLEAAFGALVERRRGGKSGGGSRLTGNGRQLLGRFDRLDVALAAAASVPETVLRGTVIDIDGELATVETAVGALGGLHEGLSIGEETQVRIGADAVTIYEPSTDPGPDSTSARNRLRGEVTAIDPGETVRTVTVDVDGTRFEALITEESTNRLDLAPGRPVIISWKATATRLVSGTYG
jgi:molybdate transport system regulatory protein